MSWAQRRGPPRPTPAVNPPMPAFNPNQHSNNEWQASAAPQTWNQPPQQAQGPPRPDVNQTQPYWQQPAYPSHQPSNVQYNQYQQPDPNSYFQNTGAGYGQQGFGNVQYSQQYEQNNMYEVQQPMQPSATESDGWSNNWGWGDDDNSNSQPVVAQPPQSQQAIGDAFSTDASWNWSLQDPQVPQETRPESNVNLFPTIGELKAQKVDKKKLDTPQWSTESQPSIESSDDVLQTSESHSPISGQEGQVENKEIVRQEALDRTQRVNPTPPPPKSLPTPPLGALPNGGPDNSINPYKRSMGLSHKSANKFKPPSSQSPLQIPPFNLETLPDNSEHPDQPMAPNTLRSGSGQQWPTENNEAPINDRNQYLETCQLSEASLGEGNEGEEPRHGVDLTTDAPPPPGLQRLVPGQLEQKEVLVDQPLPDFGRMIPGLSHVAVEADQNQKFDYSGPPEGLHRMIPGESSSPETSIRQGNVEENDSELELSHLTHSQQPRSATIGADTPPFRSQSERVLSDVAQEFINDLEGGVGEMAPVSVQPTPAVEVIKPNNVSKSKEKPDSPQDGKRDSVEGKSQPLDATISSLTQSVRNLTVGENLTDGQTSNTSLPEHSPRRYSVQESSDSESDRKKSRKNRDKRSAEKSKSKEKERERYKERDPERDRYRERNSDRYSPDPYREKRDRRDRRYKERRYEEDTDYYSDKDKDRRVRDERERDYDRKYNSLRKDKDKRRRERDPRDPRDPRDYRDRRSDYYHRGYPDEYGAENRQSRPSSRSDSLHESYRERRHEQDRERRPRDRDRERERYRNRDPRDVYNPYQSIAYDPYHPYYQQYQYYENLRRTNPQAYAEWYRKYYQQAVGSTTSFTGEDRASVHSGRSSANDELAKDRYTRQSFYSHQSNYYGQSHSISGHYGLLDSSSVGYNRTLDQTDNFDDQSQAVQRLTPAKFATAHMKASINSGKLLKILPHYPMDGQNAIVEVCSFESFLECDPNYQELTAFPGPLKKGVTHKKQIIEYCDNKIKDAMFNKDIVDVESYVLMWELLILLIRQNGMVVGTDIAELLLKNRTSEPVPRPASVLSNVSSTVGDKNEISEASNQVSELGSTMSILKEEEITRKFREYLLYGSCQEALEWAMKNGLWGHALFLASKLDKRTYANVMMRFANGLTMNDPLQTLYQLLSGKMPAVVTCASDEKWGDWRPHLAMILSNSTQRPDLNCKAMTQLGDTLLNRGSLYAAQFCYLMAQVGFGKYSDPETRLVLLGSDHRKPFPHFVLNEAVHMTEIYEFACSLNVEGFHIAEFRFYKYILATRLADCGLLERALQYLELLSTNIIEYPTEVPSSLVDGVCQLADKLKFYDPVGDEEDETTFGADYSETSRPDNSWLKELKALQNGQQANLVDNSMQQYEFNNQPEYWEQEQQQYDQQQQLQFEQQQYQEPVWSGDQPFQEKQMQQNALNHDSTSYSSGQIAQPWGEPTAQYVQETTSDPLQDSSYYDHSNNQTEEPPAPQISMPNQPKGKSGYDDEPLFNEKVQRDVNKQNDVKKVQSPAKGDNQSTGWFGGIFSRLSMKPKNQMKLPDDKNPKIVWDEKKSRWTNVDEDPNDPTNEFKPPPKMADLMPKAPALSAQPVNANYEVPTYSVDSVQMAPQPMSLPIMGSQREEVAPPKPQSNMFKMQKNRNVKNAYVDVFKQNGVKSNVEVVPAPEQVPRVAPTQMNFFIPPPVTNSNAPVDFLTPGGVPAPIGDPQNN